MLVVKEFNKRFYVVNIKTGKRKPKKGFDDMKAALEYIAEQKEGA